MISNRTLIQTDTQNGGTSVLWLEGRLLTDEFSLVPSFALLSAFHLRLLVVDRSLIVHADSHRQLSAKMPNAYCRPEAGALTCSRKAAVQSFKLEIGRVRFLSILLMVIIHTADS